MSVAERIKERMDARGENAHDAAKKIGIGYATMHGLLKGTRANPGRKTLEKVATHYGVTVDYLLGDEDKATDLRTLEAAELLAAEVAAALERYRKTISADVTKRAKEARQARQRADAAIARELRLREEQESRRKAGS